MAEVTGLGLSTSWGTPMGETTPLIRTMASMMSSRGVRYLPSLSTTEFLSKAKKSTRAKNTTMVTQMGTLGNRGWMASSWVVAPDRGRVEPMPTRMQPMT